MKRLLPLLALLPLAGCLQDTASYSFPEKDHAITLVRNQTWFWKDTVDVEVIAVNLPTCNGGGKIADVPLSTRITLFKAPDDYPEPINILKTGKRVFAVATAQSCRLQEFKEVPTDLGTRLGSFRVKDNTFQFVPADPTGKPEEE
jgi:hypothetical protein